jgi:subtilisin family serine protease
MRHPVLLVCLSAAALLLSNGGTSAQVSSRFIVQLRSTVAFDQFADAFAPDERFRSATLNGHHRRSVAGTIMWLERQHGFRAERFYTRALHGFAATLTPAQLRRLAADPMVERIEPDEVVALPPVRTASQNADWGIYRVGANLSSTVSGDGMGEVTDVHVYVIDTGVDLTHPDLNVVEHVSIIGEPNTDCHGHGTGVAGIIAARDNTAFTVGVAPGAPIHGVRVLSCLGSASASAIVAAVDWVTANAIRPAVANMSIGSLVPLPSVNAAVKNSAASGIVYAVAAGNGNPYGGNQPVNACFSSPAGAGFDFLWLNGILTVGATDLNDMEARFSNFGPCVNLWAPGVDVTTTWLMSQGGLITGSGTSFAAPYVAGAAALLLSKATALSPPVVEALLRITTDVPGTLSRDGASIRRLQVRYF